MQPDTPAPEQARADLDTARRDAEEAVRIVEDLRERVRDGQDVTAGQLGAQQQLAELAQLRAQAAERRLDNAERADRHARCTDAVRHARSILDADDTAPVVGAVTAVRAAVADLVAAVAARNADIAQAGGTLEALNDELAREAGTLGKSGAWPLFDQYQARGNRRHITVRDPEHGQMSADALSAVDLTAAAVLTVLCTDPNPRHVSNRFPLGDGTILRLGETVPGLADAWRCTREEWAPLVNTTGQTRTAAQGRQPLRESAEAP